MLKKKVAIYPGCLILYRFPEYESSAKQLLQLCGYEITFLPQALCCGSYLEGINPNWFNFTAYNLALAEKENVSLITLCGGCTNTFYRVQQMFREKPEMLHQVNLKLAEFDLKLTQTIEVQHLIKVLYEQQASLKMLKLRSLNLKVAPVYPCQVYRPGSIMHFDHPLKPKSLSALISITGATPIHYPQEHECCGSSLYLSKPEMAFQIGKQRIENLKEREADVAVTACGNCHLLLQRFQSQYISGTPLPIIFFSQLIGLALGLEPAQLHITNPSLRRMIKNAF
ncbi:CoB--CoM heterodisulfide reductase iron-sulfur subunit B family protein [Desulfitobacterium sp.]|uniref:CoB--CoM heterodisulfide reductase iron-sulfur subunit B family protein n=1 Tax=Desulfitobacterium sp. TaxID=49981 RepID=UPI002B1F6E9B|nr:CoB--CoM heterodisulfide reductase iron-sulfur subunit B family protein [Desulfitobacterium sp.]MEA4901585.1 CoB--CoM heterodisulfide reductase iron-sulfur subunit B family protein [Desulfitobacterium sp.]